MSSSDSKSAAQAELGTYPPGGLIDARKQLHHTLQLVAAAARSFAPEEPGDAHANLTWLPEHWALATRPLGYGDTRPRVALRLDKPTIAVLDDDSGKCVELALTGRIRTEATGWLRSQMALRELGAARYQLDSPYKIPHHPVVDGVCYFEPDDVSAGTTGELARWFGLAEAALQEVREREDGASDVRCWPHHFDIATLITLDPEADPEDACSIGVGMSPGDEGIEQPYFYVTPYPAADEGADLPDLPLGRWHTEGWTGAVLTGEALLAAEGASPAEHLRHFLDAAILAAHSLLEGKTP